MGCTHPKQQLESLARCKTVNGILKVTIQQVNIYKASKISSMDPYLRLIMSNQQFRGYIHKKSGRNNLFNESFEFIVNSCYKPEGRSMTVEMWNKHIINDKVIGLSIIDLDPIIGFTDKGMMESKILSANKQIAPFSMIETDKQKEKQMRRSYCKMKVFLNHEIEQVGYLNTLFEFIEQPITIVGFKFIYASLRRTSSIFTTMYCSVQAVVGEEILRTHTQKDKDTRNPPSWQDQILIFNVPKSLKQCVIRVLDDEKEVGQLRFSFGEILSKKGQYLFTEQLEHQSAISGVIKFCVMVGLDCVVTESKKDSKSRIQQQIVKTQPNQQPTQMQRQFPIQQQTYLEIKREVPSQKSTRMQQSEFKTVENISPNQEQPSRQAMKQLVREPFKLIKLQDSNIVLKGQQLKA